MISGCSPSGSCTAATLGIFWVSVLLPGVLLFMLDSVPGALVGGFGALAVPISISVSVLDVVQFVVSLRPFLALLYRPRDFTPALARAGQALSVALCGALQFTHKIGG